MSWSDLIGRQLGPYLILEELGHGATAHVYRSRDLKEGRDVAIKVIRNEADDRVGFVRRFSREVQAVSQLDHPHIVKVYDRGETDEFVYLVMECVDGGTLRRRLGRPLPVHVAVSMMIQMAEALHHAHSHGIVHRDVKPANMLLVEKDSDQLLLTDFGIAKLQGMQGLTKSGTTVGTPEYMSPEQAENHETDHRADVYALGCVLYETLAGRPPFVGATPVSVLYQQVHSRPAYLRGFNSDVPRDLARIVDQALMKRPEDRFGTAESFAQALEPFTHEENLAQPGRSTSQPLSAWPGTSAASTGAGIIVPADFHDFPTLDGWPSSNQFTLPMDTQPARSTGLGAEGLDAIFPEDRRTGLSGQQSYDDPDATIRRRKRRDGSNAQPEAEQAPPTIPLPRLRLPSRTQPLNLPLTADGQLDIDALSRHAAAQADQNEFWWQRHGGYGVAAADQTTPGPLEPDGDGRSGPPMYYTGATPTGWDGQPWNGKPGTASEGESTLKRAIQETGKNRIPPPVWRPDPEEIPYVQPRSATKRRRFAIPGVAIAAAVILSAAIFIGMGASSLAYTFGGQHPSPHTAQTQTAATPATTATAAPTSTPTTVPTATPDQQSVMSTRAAGYFRSVILSHFADNSCSSSNRTSQYQSGQSVYMDLCTSPNANSVPMTIQIRQNGQTVMTVVQNYYIAPGSSYVYWRYGMGAGTYDVLVTVMINGNSVVASDLTFTVS